MSCALRLGVRASQCRLSEVHWQVSQHATSVLCALRTWSVPRPGVFPSTAAGLGKQVHRAQNTGLAVLAAPQGWRTRCSRTASPS